MAATRYLAIPRRRRQGKTDYRKRRGIVMGKKDFLTISVSNKHLYAQIHRATSMGDLTLCYSSSSELADEGGWMGGSKNLPSAYLMGYLLGKRAKQTELGEVVYYSGIGGYIHGSRVSSVIKGARDGGLNILVDEKSLPSNERTKGKHVEDYAKKLESDEKNAFGRFFSKILASGVNPAEYSSHFETVRQKLDTSNSLMAGASSEKSR